MVQKNDLKMEKQLIMVKNSNKTKYILSSNYNIILASERYDKPEPVNVGAGFEMSIRNLVELIVELTGFAGKVVWDTSKRMGSRGDVWIRQTQR